VGERIIIEHGVLGWTETKLFTCKVCPHRHECEALNEPLDFGDLDEFKETHIMPGCDMEGREYMIYLEDGEVFVELGEWKWAEMLEKERDGHG